MWITISLIIFISLLPSQVFGHLFERIFNYFRHRSLLYRGQKLYQWLDSFGPGTVAFNLGVALPARESYRGYGVLLHETWNKVQKSGGQVGDLIRCIKYSLREDLKRTQKEHQVLRGAYAQLIFMHLMVWSYLILFEWLIKVGFSLGFWLGVIFWQLLGVFLFILLLKKKRRREFDPINDLLELVLELTMICFQGHLIQSKLNYRETIFKGTYRNFEERLYWTLENWQKMGAASKTSITELQEDLMIISADATERFIPWLKGLCFVWALIFVLPVLFAGSLFGLYKLTVV